LTLSAIFLDYLEVELARALRLVDRVCTIGRFLQEKPEGLRYEHDRRRALQIAERALKIRATIQASGVQLPALRRIEDREEQPAPFVERSEGWTVTEVAAILGVHRNTIDRWLKQSDTRPASFEAGRSTRFSLEQLLAFLDTAPVKKKPIS
jgi:excisionase family DNA binding protein